MPLSVDPSHCFLANSFTHTHIETLLHTEAFSLTCAHTHTRMHGTVIATFVVECVGGAKHVLNPDRNGAVRGLEK